MAITFGELTSSDFDGGEKMKREEKMSIHNISHLDRVRIKKTWGEHK